MIVEARNSRTDRRLNCPACGQLGAHRLRFRVNGCDILACRNCGLGRADTAGFDPAAYYTDAYFDGRHADGYADYAGSEAVLRREFKTTLRALTRHVATGRLLEIGCAYGFFLLEAQRHFEVYGIEAAEAAVRFCHSRGLAGVRAGLLDENNLRELPGMDAVVLLDVIEHLADPDEAFRLLSAKLQSNGALMLTTGDWSSLLARAMGPRWRLMTPPQHLFYFTPRSLEALGARHGLRLERISRPWKKVPLSLIAYQLKRMLRRDPQAPSDRLNRIGVPVNLFDAIRVIYRKI